MAQVSPEQAETPFVLALDIGSSSVRASLNDRQGRLVGDYVARRRWKMSVDSDGAAEADPEHIMQMVMDVIDEEIAKCGSLADAVEGVGIATLTGNIVGVDAEGQAVTPMTTYADTRAAPQAEALRQEFDEKQVHNRTGCPFHPTYLPARFRWMEAERPHWLRASTHWMSIGAYVQMRLLGLAQASYSQASWNGLLDLRAAAYDQELLAALPVKEEQFLPLADQYDGIVGLKPEYAQRWPALLDVPWFPPIGDGAVANLGSGCISDQQIAVTIGTSSAVRVVLERVPQRIPTGLWCYRIDSEQVLLGGALSEGGSVYAWLTDTLDFGDEANLDAALVQVEPDSHGLTLLPLLRGERSPGYAAHMLGSVHGLSISTTPIDLLRAGLEGVSYRIGLLVNLLDQHLGDHTEVIASGGGMLSSSVWPQILADVIGRPLTISEVPEASSRGVALTTLLGIGAIESLDSVPGFTGVEHQPDIETHKVYRNAMQRQQTLYNWQRNFDTNKGD